jgi:hypothetical protein
MDWDSPLPEIMNRFSDKFDPTKGEEKKKEKKNALELEMKKSYRAVPDKHWPLPLPLSTPVQVPVSVPVDASSAATPPSTQDANVDAEEFDVEDAEVDEKVDAMWASMTANVAASADDPSDAARTEAQLDEMEVEKPDVATARGDEFDAQRPDYEQTFKEEEQSFNPDAAPRVEGMESHIKPIGTIFGGLGRASNGWSSMRCRFHPVLTEEQWKAEATKEARQSVRVVKAPSASKEEIDGQLESCCDPPPDYARIIITLSEAFQIELFRNRVQKTAMPVKTALQAVARHLAVPIGQGNADQAIPLMAYSDAHPLMLMACGRYWRQYHGRFLLAIESGAEASSLAATRFPVSRDCGKVNLELDLMLLNCMLRHGLILHGHIQNLVNFCMQGSFWVEERERKCIVAAMLVCNDARSFAMRFPTKRRAEEFQELTRQCFANGLKHNFVRFVAEGHLKRTDSGYGPADFASADSTERNKMMNTNLNNCMGERGTIPHHWDAVFFARTVWVARETDQWNAMLAGKRLKVECADEFMADTWRSAKNFSQAYSHFAKCKEKIYPHDFRDEALRGTKEIFDHFRQVYSALRGKWSVSKAEAMALVKYTSDAACIKPNEVSVACDALSFVASGLSYQPGDVYKKYYALAAGACMLLSDDAPDGGSGGAFGESQGKVENIMKSFFEMPAPGEKHKGRFKGLYVSPLVNTSEDETINLAEHAAMNGIGVSAQPVCKSATISRVSTEHKLGASDLAQFDQLAMNAEQKATYRAYMDQSVARKQAVAAFATAVQTAFSALAERDGGESIVAAWLRSGGSNAAVKGMRDAIGIDEYDDLEDEEEASARRIASFWPLIVKLDEAHYKPWKAAPCAEDWTLEQHMALARLLESIFSQLDAQDGKLVNGKVQAETFCCAPAAGPGMRYQTLLDAIEDLRATPQLRNATLQLATVFCSAAELPRKDPASQKRKRAFETVITSTPAQFAVQCEQYLNQQCHETSEPLLRELRQTSNKYDYATSYDLEGELAAGHDRACAIGAEDRFETTAAAHRSKYEKRLNNASTNFKEAKEKFDTWRREQTALLADLEAFKAAGDNWRSLSGNQIALQYEMHLGSDGPYAKKKKLQRWELLDPEFCACMLAESSDAMKHANEQYDSITK